MAERWAPWRRSRVEQVPEKEHAGGQHADVHHIVQCRVDQCGIVVCRQLPELQARHVYGRANQWPGQEAKKRLNAVVAHHGRHDPTADTLGNSGEKRTRWQGEHQEHRRDAAQQ